MTHNQFFEELSKIRGFQLHFGKLRKFVGEREVCPICAVANRKMKKTKFGLNAGTAGDYLGLDDGFVSSVMFAADNSYILTGMLSGLRDKLLSVTKLK